MCQYADVPLTIRYHSAANWHIDRMVALNNSLYHGGSVAICTEKEKAELFALEKRLIRSAGESITKDDTRKLKKYLIQSCPVQRAAPQQLRDESRHQGFTNGGCRGRRNRHERIVPDRHHAARDSEGT